MDWALAIERNRKALLRLLAVLFAAAGMQSGKAVSTLPRHVRSMVFRLLRPAEAAVRRLIVIEARGMSAAPVARRPAPAQPIPRGTGTGRAPVFRLIDPRKRFGRPIGRRFARAPRLTFIGADVYHHEPPKPEASPDDPVSAERLCRRMMALQRALNDLPAQARRLARLRTRNRLSPLRPGRPPGYRARGRHEIDEILGECQTLALWALRPPDTS